MCWITAVSLPITPEILMVMFFRSWRLDSPQQLVCSLQLAVLLRELIPDGVDLLSKEGSG